SIINPQLSTIDREWGRSHYNYQRSIDREWGRSHYNYQRSIASEWGHSHYNYQRSIASELPTLALQLSTINYSPFQSGQKTQ
ncbi:MAG: hypothetical protein ACRC62_17080, partial [Microcoleus sp.]